MNVTSTCPPTKPDDDRTSGKRRPERPGREKSVDMHPPKKPKPGSPQIPSQDRPELPAIHDTQQFGKQPAVDSKWFFMFDVYAEVAAKSDLGSFPKYVEMCRPEAWPVLAKKITDGLVAFLAAEEQSSPANCTVVSEKPTVPEPVKRVVIALTNGLPLSQVISCLTAKEWRLPEVRALSLLLRDCAIRDIKAGKMVNLLLWTQCIGQAASAQVWMTQLGWSLAAEFEGDHRLREGLFSAMTSLAAEVRRYPEEAKLVVALLDGLEGVRDLNLGNSDADQPEANQPHLDEARTKCLRLRAQLTQEAARLVSDLDAAVSKASALANEAIAQPAGAEQRKERIRENLQVQKLCSDIADGLARGLLTLKEVIGALERRSAASGTVEALMHVLVVQKKSNGGELHAFFRNVLNEAGRPQELVLYMAPALLECESDVGLAGGLIHRLADEAAGAFAPLLPILGLIEALCRAQGHWTLLSLNERMKGRVQEAAAMLVMQARQCVQDAAGNLFTVLQLERTARLTKEQLELLGVGPVEDSLEALVKPLDSHLACAYVLEALRSFIDLPACNYLVSLLVRALDERWTVMDVFIGTLVNADVPPKAKRAHLALAQEVALGFKDWVSSGVGLDGRIQRWIDTASAMGFEVLQTLLGSLVLLDKWGSDIKASLIKRLIEVEKRWMTAKADVLIEQYIVPVIDLIAQTRKQMRVAEESLLVDHKKEFLENDPINVAANQLVLAMRCSDIPTNEVIKWFSTLRKPTFDWQLLLFKVIDPLFGESAVSPPYELNNFMKLLFDIDGDFDFFVDAGKVFAMREELDTHRDRMIGTIQTLAHQYEGDKLSNLQLFTIEYHEGSNRKDEKSRELGVLLQAITARVEAEDALGGPVGLSLVPPPTTFAVQQAVSALPTTGMPSIYSGGLPPEYSLVPPQDNTSIRLIPPSVSPVNAVSHRNEGNLIAKDVAKALNEGRTHDVKEMIRNAHSTVLDLTGPDVPMLRLKGLIALGEIISDPSVHLRELFLGRAVRGISNVTNAIGKSKHLKVLNLCSFQGHDLDSYWFYNIENLLEQIEKLFLSQTISLQRVVVSNAAIAVDNAESALAKLKAAAGSRLEVERRN